MEQRFESLTVERTPYFGCDLLLDREPKEGRLIRRKADAVGTYHSGDPAALRFPLPQELHTLVENHCSFAKAISHEGCNSHRLPTYRVPWLCPFWGFFFE
jgi:hypothetical protein